MISEVLLIGAILVMAVVVCLLFCYLLALLDIGFTIIPEGEIKFIVVGGDLRQILVNVTGYGAVGKEDGEKWIEKESMPIWAWTDPRTWLRKWFNIYGPFFWPLWTVHKYRFEWDMLKPIKGKPGEYEIDPRDEVVNSMYQMFTYPVKVTGAELADKIAIDMVVNVTLVTVRPELAIFRLKGKWFERVREIIQGRISKFCQTVTFDELFPVKNEPGTQTGDSQLAKLTEEAKKENPVLLKTTGVEVEECNFVSFAIAEGSGHEEVVAATRALALAQMKGRATLETAQYKARAIALVGKARAEVIEAQVAASDEETVRMLAMATAIEKFSGQVLNVGGGKMGIMPTVQTEPNRSKNKPNP